MGTRFNDVAHRSADGGPAIFCINAVEHGSVLIQIERPISQREAVRRSSIRALLASPGIAFSQRSLALLASDIQNLVTRIRQLAGCAEKSFFSVFLHSAEEI